MFRNGFAMQGARLPKGMDLLVFTVRHIRLLREYLSLRYEYNWSTLLPQSVTLCFVLQIFRKEV